ncbi:TPA: Eco57I restriction-modification methylase domain-containing protein [Legionella feeleii]
MEPNLIFRTAHVVDILGNVVGRDQQIMTMEKARDLVSLLDKKDFTDEKVVFFDPFCKAGEVLLACAFSSCWHKSNLEGKPLALEHVKKELYESNRYFGLSPDERHHKLSLRTFLGNTNSHSEKYNQIIRNGNYLSEIDGRLDHDKFKGEFYKMLDYINSSSKPRKVIAVGNPPYQESDGGAGGSAKPIYNFFVETLMSSNVIDEFVLVIPARWFSAGKGLDTFRKKIMECNQIKSITYFEKAEEIFPTVQIKGGLCFLHWSLASNESKPVFITGVKQTSIDLAQYDIIPDDPYSTIIINKIINSGQIHKFVSSIAWSGKPFGLRTYYFQRNESVNEKSPTAIKCYTAGRKIKYIERTSIIKNTDKIDLYKVVVPKAYGKGMKRCTLPKHQIFILEKGDICTETYNVVGCYESRLLAENLQCYLQTDFARYLLGLRKITQDIPKDRWNWVPYVDISKKWTDRELSIHFGLTTEEQLHVKKKVEEWG